MKKKVCGFFLLFVFVLAAFFISCDLFFPNDPDKTPVSGDYTVGNLSQTAGSVTAVTITAKSGKSPGAVSNIRYAGINSLPQTAGTYSVTFDVAEASGWKAAKGLSAGSLTVNSSNSGNQTPVAGDYAFGKLGQTAGIVIAVTITPKSGKSPGVISNIRYAGNTAIPQTTGIFAVTFDVAAVSGWNAATGLSAGYLNVYPASASNQTPIASDYTFGKLGQTAGSVTAVTITANSGKSPGAINNIRYNNSITIPQTAGTYPVTFDVDAALGWNMATDLYAGNLFVTSAGGNQTANGITFTQTGDNVTISGYTGNNGSNTVTIPEEINGIPVTTIGSQAFTNKQLTSVSIPNNVTTIGANAFSGNQLTSVTIPNSVTTIGANAFDNNRLTSVTIGNSVITIGDSAFTNNRLTNVSIPNSVITIGANAFEGSVDGGPPEGNRLTSVSIGNSVTTIGDSAFSGNQLTSVTIPNSVLTIGEGAFKWNQLTSVSIPNSVTTMGDYAFSGNQLTSVTISNSVTAIGDGAFSENQLSSVSIPNSVKTIGDYAFCENQLTGVTIPNGVTTIGEAAFAVNGLTSVTIPASVTSIGDLAFAYCTSLTSITVEASNPNYSSGGGILYNKAQTTLIQAPGAISGAVTIPAGVTSIGKGAFYSCENLASVTLPASVTSIGEGAFYGCTSLTGVIIPNGITAIGESAFAYSGLTSVSVPDSVITIGGDAFSDNQLTSVTIGNSVTTIGDSAFAWNQLASVTIPDSVITIGGDAFYGNQLTSVTIGNSVTTIGDSAFAWNQLASVSIPNSVTTIGVAAFDDNPLTSVTIGPSVTLDRVVYGNDVYPVFPGDLDSVYNNDGRLAGTYTRPNTSSKAWTK